MPGEGKFKRDIDGWTRWIGTGLAAGNMLMKETGLPKIEDSMTVDPITVSPQDAIGKAIELMLINDIRHLPVIERGTLVGMLSDRDIGPLSGTDALALEGNGLVRELMSSRAVACKKNATVEDAIKIMVKHKIGSIAIVDEENHLTGIFTEYDALQFCLYLIERHAHSGAHGKESY